MLERGQREPQGRPRDAQPLHQWQLGHARAGGELAADEQLAQPQQRPRDLSSVGLVCHVCCRCRAPRSAHRVAVVIAAGALATPGLLIRSGVREAGGGSPSGELIGRNLGFHPARGVEGLFDEVQDAHMVYPISSHCMQFQRHEAGGFVAEAATVQDPIGFARRLGRRLIRAASGRAGMRRGSRTRGYGAGALSLEGL